MDIKLSQSYNVNKSLRLKNGMYLASPSDDYSFVWLRDTMYCVWPFIDKSCDWFEQTMWSILDMMIDLEWKIDIHQTKKPIHQHEFIHAKYDAHTLKELNIEWGHSQNDAVGLILFGIGKGIQAGKKIIRNEKDHQIVQKLVGYLKCVEYWDCEDSGVWEEYREIHSSSVGACVAGLEAVKDIVFVEQELIQKGYQRLSNLYPRESITKPVDLAQLSLVYPYNILLPHEQMEIVRRVEILLLREKAVIRYMGDSYYATNEYEGRYHHPSHYYTKEAEWSFGIPWLALCHLQFGNIEKAEEYVKWTEELMLEDGSLPELYFAGSNSYNGNSPLGWSNSMHILAKEALIAAKEKQQVGTV